MSETAIRLKQAVVCAGERTLLDAIDLSVTHGERLAIVGHNGAGKSTLLKMLTGMVRASHGEIQVLDHAMHRPISARQMRALRATVGQVFQGLHLVHRLTALENVLLGGLAHHRHWLSWARIFPRAERLRAEAALQAVGLIGRGQVRADRLSGGERQKTAIARVLMQSPRLILADEPTAALDPLAAVEIASLLSSLAQRHRMTLITVVHDPGLLPLLSDRVIGLRNGRLIFDRPTGEVGDVHLRQLYRDDGGASWVSRFNRTALSVEEHV